MRKFRILAVSVAVLASTFALTTAQSASAAPSRCVGQGTVTLVPTTPVDGLWAAGMGPMVNANLSGTISCLVGPTLVISGNLTGHCGRSVGVVTVSGHTYLLDTAGTILTLTDLGPGVGVGVGHVIADPVHGPHGTHTSNSCSLGTAHEFLVTGLVIHI